MLEKCKVTLRSLLTVYFELFSLPRKGSEQSFLFRRTAGILSEITICSVYSVFCRLIFLSEIPNHTRWLTLAYIAPSHLTCLHNPVIPSFSKNQLSVLHLISAILSGYSLLLASDLCTVQYPYPLLLQNSLLLPIIPHSKSVLSNTLPSPPPLHLLPKLVWPADPFSIFPD
jgi:hypothetical protein